MQIIANDIREGNILLYNDKLYIVTKPPEHTKPGKGGAFVQVEMSELKNKTKLNERFRSTEKVEKARLDEIDYQFLYMENDKIIAMNTENYEQIEIDQSILGKKAAFLQESMPLTISMYESQVISVTLPTQVVCEIAETEPVIKGQTAASSYKPAVLTNGLRITVPPFINIGDKVFVRTEDITYLERAK